MENYDNAFVQEVRSNPRDDAPRLIYADYLEEAGDPRGELIRVQIELANAQVGHPASSALVARERELLDQHAERWLGPLRDLGAIGVSSRCFQRGLIERVRIRASDFVAHGEEICRISPALYCIDLRDPSEVLEPLAATVFASQITVLDLSSNGLNEDHLKVLQAAPWWRQLTAIDLQFNQLEDRGVAALAMIDCPMLEQLSLGVNRIGPDGIRSLRSWPALRRVERLALGVNQIGDLGAEQLASASYLASMQELDLASNKIGSRGAVAIAQATNWESIKRLILRGNSINRDGFEALAQSPALELAQLELLDVRNNAAALDDALRDRFGKALVGSAEPSSRYQ